MSALVRGTVQRSPVSARFHETLYNSENATTAQAQAGGYAGGRPTATANAQSASYDLARAPDDSGVTVLVKIRFLQQQRNTTPPPSPNPTNLPGLGTMIGSPTEIPATDPDDRRGWATGMAQQAAALWTSKQLSFRSVDHTTEPDPDSAAGSEATVTRPVSLPVTFTAQAVFGAAEDAHQQVVVHPPSSVPGSPGHPIDAGSWYRQDDAHRSTSYPGSDQMIYAHEYGHLLGIPDEYSQSNEQMNSLIHQAAPDTAAASMAALDRTTVERMTLAALTRPLQRALGAAMPAVAAALGSQRAAVLAKAEDAAREGVRDDAVRTELETQLTAGTDAARVGDVPRVVAFETTRNFSNVAVAARAVDSVFAVGPLGRLLGRAYSTALTAPQGDAVAVAGVDDVRINPSTAVYASTDSGATQAPAAAVAGADVAPAAAPGLPAVTPSGGLVASLSALPATWSAAGSQLEAQVTPAAFATAMAQALRSAQAARDAAASAAASATPPGPAAPTNATSGALYRDAYRRVSAGAGAAAEQLIVELVNATVQPTLAADVTALQSTIATEVARVMTTPPAALAAAPPDPNMAAVVSAMKTRLDADKLATTGTGRDPTSGGGAVADQSVTYSAQGLMGSTTTGAVRADQFAGMLAAFNTTGKRPTEDAFTAAVGGP